MQWEISTYQKGTAQQVKGLEKEHNYSGITNEGKKGGGDLI